MKNHWFIQLMGVCMLSFVFMGCAKESPKDVVVVDKMETLDDGAMIAYRLTPGMYRLEMTASNDGASVEWIGATCPPSGEVKVYNALCEFRQDGQLVVKNPTVFASGAGTTVTIKVTKINLVNSQD